MVRVMARRTMIHRILTCDKPEIMTFSGDIASINISDTIFGFLNDESSQNIPLNFCGENEDDVDDEEEEEKEESENVKDNRFWEIQHQLLQVISNTRFFFPF